MGTNNWRTQLNMNDWMRDIEKRLMHEERRLSVAPAYDIVGPGISTYSVQVNDWNSEGPVVDGFFYSFAGQVVNSPNDTLNWMGIVQANPEGQGLQRVWEYIDTAEAPSPEPALYTRAFVTEEDGTRTYTEWLVGGGSGGGSALVVNDEGVVLTSAATQLNFKGTGVTATLAAAGHVDVDIAGGGGGGAPTGPAGGDLTGTYPNPSIATGVIVDTDVHINNKDGGAAIPSMRTLGTGAQQAAAGNHRHTLSAIDAGGVLSSPLVVAEQLVTPPTPTSGAGAYYFKDDGLPYALNDAGIEYPLIPASSALHSNPGFESYAYVGLPVDAWRPTLWNFFWCGANAVANTESTIPADIFSGKASLMLTQQSTAASYCVVQSTQFDCLPGSVLTFQFWAKSINLGQQFRIECLMAPPFTGPPEYYDADTISVGTSVALTQTWARYQVQFSVPAGMGVARFVLRTVEGSNGKIWIDETSSSMTATSGGGSTGGSGNIEAYHCRATASISPLSTTRQNIPGMIVNVPVSGTAEKLLVVASYDFDWLSGTGGQALANLMVDGVEWPQGLAIFQQATSGRATVFQNWLVTGLSAGTHEFGGQAWCNTTLMALLGAAADSGSHTRMSIIKLVGPQAGKWYVQGLAYPDPENVPFPITGDMYLYGNSGDVFQYDGTQWVYSGWSIKGPANALNLKDEGVTVNAAITTLDFKGSGVSVIDGGGGTGLVTIAGPGAASPIGSMVMYLPATPPEGWLLCDGAAIPPQYNTLIALIGANTPDLRVRMPVGAGTGAALGSSDGLAENARSGRLTHTHTGASITIGTTGSGHTHDAGGLANTSSAHSRGTDMTRTGSGVYLWDTAAGATHNHTINGSTGTTGSGHTHNTGGSTGVNAGLPFLAVNYIIKAQ